MDLFNKQHLGSCLSAPLSRRVQKLPGMNLSRGVEPEQKKTPSHLDPISVCLLELCAHLLHSGFFLFFFSLPKVANVISGHSTSSLLPLISRFSSVSPHASLDVASLSPEVPDATSHLVLSLLTSYHFHFFSPDFVSPYEPKSLLIQSSHLLLLLPSHFITASVTWSHSCDLHGVPHITLLILTETHHGERFPFIPAHQDSSSICHRLLPFDLSTPRATERKGVRLCVYREEFNSL